MLKKSTRMQRNPAVDEKLRALIDDYKKVAAQLAAIYQPQDYDEERLVQLMAYAEWSLRQADRWEARAYQQEMSEAKRIEFLDEIAQTRKRLRRSWQRSFKELQKCQSARAEPGPSIPYRYLN
jgi:hypothetical protein